MEKINIAIDGPSAAGKSTIAKILATKLGYSYLDTGAMYRCVAYATKKYNVDAKDEVAVSALMDQIHINFLQNGTILLDNEDVSSNIRASEMSMLASDISAFSKVRQKLVQMQQEIAKNKGYILDGRDIGTVVLPDAKIKIYLIASSKTRANRRYMENLQKGIVCSYDEILADIEKRDYQDMNRQESPLKKADDAIQIDTSNMNLEDVVAAIENIIKDNK